MTSRLFRRFTIGFAVVSAIAMLVTEPAGAAPRQAVNFYRGFSIIGGPTYSGKTLSAAPARWRAAVLESARTGQTEVFNDSTKAYVTASSAPGRVGSQDIPTDVSSGYLLPGGSRTGAYTWQQTSATELGVIDIYGNVDAEVFIKIKESITGNTSDYWHYEYSLNQVSGGLWRLDVGYQCAVNKTGVPDDYCTVISYPDGSKDVGVTASHSTEIHDLATGNTTNNQTTGFFGTHSTPPPSGSKQVVKYAQLYETAYFQQYNVYDHASIRTFDVCVPNKATFSGVTLCATSGTGT